MRYSKISSKTKSGFRRASTRNKKMINERQYMIKNLGEAFKRAESDQKFISKVFSVAFVVITIILFIFVLLLIYIVYQINSEPPTQHEPFNIVFQNISWVYFFYSFVAFFVFFRISIFFFINRVTDNSVQNLAHFLFNFFGEKLWISIGMAIFSAILSTLLGSVFSKTPIVNLSNTLVNSHTIILSHKSDMSEAKTGIKGSETDDDRNKTLAVVYFDNQSSLLPKSSKQSVQVIDIVNALEICASKDAPVILNIRGFASSADFNVRPNSELSSDEKNIQLANSRALTVIDIIKANDQTSLLKIKFDPWSDINDMKKAITLNDRPFRGNERTSAEAINRSAVIYLASGGLCHIEVK